MKVSIDDIRNQLPEPEPTPVKDIPTIVQQVHANRQAWIDLPVKEKLTILYEIRTLLDKEKEAWVNTGSIMHGYDPKDPAFAHLVGEVWAISIAFAGNWLNGIIKTYESLSNGKLPQVASMRNVTNHVRALQVFPSQAMGEKILSGGMKAELFVDAEEHASVRQFDLMDKDAAEPTLVCILGAGNYDAFVDILHTLFLERKVVIFKPNPVNHKTIEHVKRVLSPLSSRGFLDYVVGGLEQSKAVTEQPLVQELSMIGSYRTYNMIMWGDQVKRDQKRLDIPFKAELGNVNPYIICPDDDWSSKDIDAHACQLAAAKHFNGSFICASPQLLLTWKPWKQREAFVQKVRHHLVNSKASAPFYVNSDRSYAQQVENTKDFAAGSCCCENEPLYDGQLHPLFVDGIDVHNLLEKNDFICKNEAFCPCLYEIVFDSPSRDQFMKDVVKFCNEHLWGNLAATLIAKKPEEPLVQQTLVDLKYGSIGVNQWAGFCVFFPQLGWGGGPLHTGNPPEDIQSGRGYIGNTYCIENPIKSVLTAPFLSLNQQKLADNKQVYLKQQYRLADYCVYPTVWRSTKMLANVVAGL